MHSGPHLGSHSTEEQCFPSPCSAENQNCRFMKKNKKQNKYADIVKVLRHFFGWSHRGGGMSLGCQSCIPPGLEYRSSTTACLFSDADLHSTKYSCNPYRGAHSQSQTTWIWSPSVTHLPWDKKAKKKKRQCFSWAGETLSSQQSSSSRGGWRSCEAIPPTHRWKTTKCDRAILWW